MNGVIQKIICHKQEEIRCRKKRVPIEQFRRVISELPPCRNFRKALKKGEEIAVIAEIKRASPSAGIIRSHFDPLAIADAYQQNGADAISILTEEKYFGGRIDYIAQLRPRVNLPILRKDFIIDAYQMYESRVAGADAVLLIAAILSPSQCRELLDLAAELGLAVLLEVHNQEELQQALHEGGQIIGINNRDLRTMQVHLHTTRDLALHIPQGLVCVSESGIRSRADVEMLSRFGIDAVLIGETLMRAPDPGRALNEFLGVPRCSRSKFAASPT